MRQLLSTSSFFILLSVLFIILGMSYNDASIKIALYGALFDVSVWALCLVSAVFFLLISVNYFALKLMGKPAKKGLTIAHIITQLLAIAPLVYLISITSGISSYEEVSRYNLILMFSFVLFVISIVIHLINFFSSLLLKKD